MNKIGPLSLWERVSVRAFGDKVSQTVRYRLFAAMAVGIVTFGVPNAAFSASGDEGEFGHGGDFLHGDLPLDIVEYRAEIAIQILVEHLQCFFNERSIAFGIL